MNDRLPRRYRFHTTMWSVFGLVLACLVLSLGLVVVGCGGGASQTDTTAAATGETTATTAAVEEMGGTELGEAIGAAWAEATQKLNALLEGQPEASAVQADVKALKEEYVQKMVAFGEQRQTLDAGAQTEASSATVLALDRAAGADWYATYVTNYEAYSYSSGNVDFCNLLASFRILTQYGDFELLKSQDPEEAARLGIE
jgi:hypothetical protein